MAAYNKLMGVGLLFVLSAHGAIAAPGGSEAFGRNVEYAVVFAITPDADGKLVKCVFDSIEVVDPARSAKDFRPSDAFVASACAAFADRKWKVIQALHDIKPVHDFCFWSKVAPDEPKCPIYPDE